MEPGFHRESHLGKALLPASTTPPVTTTQITQITPNTANALDIPLLNSRRLLHAATRIIVIAGAGLSADIGTPVYWTGDNAAYGDTVSHFGHTNLEHSCAPLWQEEPEQQAAFFRETWRGMRESVKPPHADDPYCVLQDWLASAAKDYFVLTSNVDTAFTDHGFPADRLLEIHGAYDRSQCLAEPEAHGIFPTVDPSRGDTVCPVCGGIARPNVLFFDDYWFNDSANELQEERFRAFQNGFGSRTPVDGRASGDSRRTGAGTGTGTGNCDTVILEIGVGLTVMNLRRLSREVHARYDLPVVRINPVHVRRGDHVSAGNAPVYEHQLTAIEGLRALLS
jgi:NAD-dependent SIR2 family protein deacetylase